MNDINDKIYKISLACPFADLVQTNALYMARLYKLRLGPVPSSTSFWHQSTMPISERFKEELQ
jgi:hypothetical protein